MGSTASLPRGAALLRTYSPAVGALPADRLKPLPTGIYAITHFLNISNRFMPTACNTHAYCCCYFIYGFLVHSFWLCNFCKVRPQSPNVPTPVGRRGPVTCHHGHQKDLAHFSGPQTPLFLYQVGENHRNNLQKY